MTANRNVKRIKLDHKGEDDETIKIPLAAGPIVFGNYELVEQIIVIVLARQSREAVRQVFVLQRLNRLVHNVITTSPSIEQLLHLRPSNKSLSSDGLMYWMDLIREPYVPLYPQYFGIWTALTSPNKSS